MDKNKKIETLEEYFNGIEWLMTGNKEYNNTFQRELVLTMNRLDPNLTKSVAAQWEQIKKYASLNFSPFADSFVTKGKLKSLAKFKALSLCSEDS